MVQNYKTWKNKWWWLLLLSFIVLCILAAVYLADVPLLNEHPGRGTDGKVIRDHAVVMNALIDSKYSDIFKTSLSDEKGIHLKNPTVNSAVTVKVWGVTEKELSDIRSIIKQTVQQENVVTDVIIKVFEECNVVRKNDAIQYKFNYGSFKKNITVKAP